MMKLNLAVVFFITCFLYCVFVTSVPDPTSPVPPLPDQVEILLAFKNEFPSRNCSRKWKTPDEILNDPNISSWTREANYFDGVHFDDKTGVVTELYLGGACISGTIQTNSSLFKLQHLRYLDLSGNNFDSSPLPAGFGRLTKLEHLDLSENGFIGEVPSSISNLSRLSHLDLSYNHYSETIPSSLFTMPSLQILDLRHNHLRDPLENMSSSATSKLEFLDMAENLLSCRILESISNLANLTALDLSFQSTTCTSNYDLSPFKSLQSLDLSGNGISMLNTSSTYLNDLFLSSCNITEFPASIKTLRNLEELNISKNRIKGKVPEWLWDLPFLRWVNISHNSFNVLEGSSKVLLNSPILEEIDLSSNTFYGSFPILPLFIGVLAASNNNFTGHIPLTLCDRTELRLVDLSNNSFSGSIPRCLCEISSLEVLKLSNNNLTGRLPHIQGSNPVKMLDVGHNQISGKLPRSLVKCKSLKFLNVESNRITGTFPFWLTGLPGLEVMVLRSNRFHGPLSSPQNPLPFPALRIIDISLNKFNGSLPPNYFVNWSLPLVNITQVYSSPGYIGDSDDWHSDIPKPWYYPSIYLSNKGLSMEFEKIQDIFTAIDFSGNRLEGQIPKSIGLLESLIALDLSNNNFSGYIPSSLFKLTQLESLDLSRNHLTGKIPQELKALTFLSYINMSHNKLTGQIPQGTQIGGQPESCFVGNIDLCGLPLEEGCFKENGEPSTLPETQEAEQDHVFNWKAAAIGYGPGVLLGMVIAQALAMYKPVLFYKLFRL